MSTIIADNLTGKTSAGSVTVTSEGGAATMQLQQGLAKAWVRANSAVIQDSQSFNVSSSTDHGAGDFSHALTNSLDTLGVLETTVRRTGNNIASYANENRDSASVMAVLCYNVSTGGNTDSRYLLVYLGDLA